MNTQKEKPEAFEATFGLRLNGEPAHMTNRALTYGRREVERNDHTDRCVLSARQLGDLFTKRAGDWWTRDQSWRRP